MDNCPPRALGAQRKRQSIAGGASGADRLETEDDNVYAITIHKSQGSEFPVVVTPLAMQQYIPLQRNLVYAHCPEKALRRCAARLVSMLT